jgi:mannitol-1-phosphate 5-dehydrogenase
VSIVICENLRNAARVARETLEHLLPEGFDLPGRVGLVETSIGKMVPRMPDEVRARDPLEIWGEAYNAIVADGRGFVGPPPAVEGVVLKDNFEAHVDRKLFVHNLGHAAAAYHGFGAGKTFIWECVEEPAIRAETELAMWESGHALMKRYPEEFTEADQRAHIDDLLRRFHNRALGDTVYRVGCDLRRKLAPDDRCIGALRLCRREGVDPAHIVGVLAAAFRFRATDPSGAMFPADEEFHRELATRGVRSMLVEVCGLDARVDADLIELICARTSV